MGTESGIQQGREHLSAKRGVPSSLSVHGRVGAVDYQKLHEKLTADGNVAAHWEMRALDGQASLSAPKGPSQDVRKRMDDIYGEMEQNWKNGRFRLPLKFISFHESETMFLFVRAAIGYALAFVKVKTLQRDHADRSFEDPRVRSDDHWRERIALVIDNQASCATAMAAAYARLVLHCSNYENHKEDEHFFECVYFFVCSVVKLSIPPDYWKTMEEELGFLFRGAQFSSNVKTHTTTAYKESAAIATAEKDAPPASSAAKKIQSLSANSEKESGSRGVDATRFVLPSAQRPSYFTESVPVKKIVSNMDATKTRATRNIEISQAIRERIQNQKTEAYKRQLEAVVTPRQSVRLEMTDPAIGVQCRGPSATSAVAKSPSGAHRAKGLVSPRISMRTTFTTRSPALNHLLPATEERVRLVLMDYEQELQQKMQALRSRSPRRVEGLAQSSESSTQSLTQQQR